VGPRLGIIGGGQLGMMLARSAEPLGIPCVALDPDPGCPASHACEVIAGAFDDADALDAFASRCDVVTYEFENVPVASARRLASRVAVRPDPVALETAQECHDDLSCYIGKLDDDEPLVVRKAAYMIARYGRGNDDAIAALVEILDHRATPVRGDALYALDAIATSGSAAGVADVERACRIDRDELDLDLLPCSILRVAICIG